MSHARMTAIAPEALRELETIVPLIRDAALEGRDPGWHPENFDSGIAVRPSSIEAVQQVVAWSAVHGVEIVAQGGRTGLAGAAATTPGQIVLMMDQLSQIVEIDEAAGAVTVEAGATLESVEAFVAERGFSVGIDLAARGSCTIGGLIGTNAGGIEAFEQGVMRHRVLGIEAVIADGSVMSDLKEVIKANEGYDVKQLFIGSEGTLGRRIAIGTKTIAWHCGASCMLRQRQGGSSIPDAPPCAPGRAPSSGGHVSSLSRRRR